MKTKKTILTIIILIVLLLNVYKVNAQIRFGDKESFATSIYLDPVASVKEKGLDIGADIEYRGFLLVKAGIESFEELEGGYFDIHGVIAPRFTIGQMERLSLYAGLRLGVVFRYSQPNPIMGFEGGIDYVFPSGLLIGVNASYMRRGDIEAIYRLENFWRENGYVRIGYSWDW